MVSGFTIDTYKPNHFGINPEAMPAWRALCSAQDKAEFYPCMNNPYFYTDYDGLGFERDSGYKVSLTEDDCEALCYGCPLLKQCYDFATANKEKYGIWGGIDFSAKPDTIF